MNRKLLIIINNAAAKARHAWPLVRERLSDAGVALIFTKRFDPAMRPANSRALRNGTTAIAVVGGDGTLSEVAQGFFEFNEHIENLPTPISPEAVLAILPAGTGDDFARSQKGQREPLHTWIDILISHCQRPATRDLSPRGRALWIM